MKSIVGIRVVLAAAAALSFALPPAAQAAPKGGPSPQQQCEAGGHLWDAKKGCANKTCTSGGKTYQPGDTINMPRTKSNPSPGYSMCDGFTGAWEIHQ